MAYDSFPCFYMYVCTNIKIQLSIVDNLPDVKMCPETFGIGLSQTGVEFGVNFIFVNCYLVRSNTPNSCLEFTSSDIGCFVCIWREVVYLCTVCPPPPAPPPPLHLLQVPAQPEATSEPVCCAVSWYSLSKKRTHYGWTPRTSGVCWSEPLHRTSLSEPQ